MDGYENWNFEHGNWKAFGPLIHVFGLESNSSD